MNDGPKKPTYEPPKLGGEMEKYGLTYDTGAVQEVVPRSGKQKRHRNRNKNNRRDPNRPQKETRMNEGMATMNGAEGSKQGEHESTSPPQNYIRELTQVIQEHLKDQREERAELRSYLQQSNASFKSFGETLKEYNGHAEKLNEGMAIVKTASDRASLAAEEAEQVAKHIPEKLNKVLDRDNLKGDVRRAVVQTAVTFLIGGAFMVAMSVFGRKAPRKAPSPEASPATPAPAPAPKKV